MDYVNLRLTAAYDSLNPVAENERFYQALAGAPGKAILDMGCGTGRLAAALAMLGHQVTGADPAPAMLDIARRRRGGDKVRWVESDAGGQALAARFDLIIMTGHAFQKLLSDEAIRAAFGAFARHLAPGGILAFETRNPMKREWEQWIPERSRETVTLPNGSTVDVHNDIRSVAGDLVTYETHVIYGPNDKEVGADTLRFIDRETLKRRLDLAGLRRQVWYGDWDKSPVGVASPELIVLAQL